MMGGRLAKELTGAGKETTKAPRLAVSAATMTDRVAGREDTVEAMAKGKGKGKGKSDRRYCYAVNN